MALTTISSPRKKGFGESSKLDLVRAWKNFLTVSLKVFKTKTCIRGQLESSAAGRPGLGSRLTMPAAVIAVVAA